eukprot:m.21287 g.21287  ORF g.21287 m.21287 type:complete len:118 (-) comp11121_c0_seq1:311-664(-)
MASCDHATNTMQQSRITSGPTARVTRRMRDQRRMEMFLLQNGIAKLKRMQHQNTSSSSDSRSSEPAPAPSSRGLTSSGDYYRRARHRGQVASAAVKPSSKSLSRPLEKVPGKQVKLA